MKHSKLFLGITTACLAIAGVVAAKATRFGSDVAYYFTKSNNTGKCLSVNSGYVEDPAGTIQYTVLYGTQHRAAFTKSDCTVAFMTNQVL